MSAGGLKLVPDERKDSTKFESGERHAPVSEHSPDAPPSREAQLEVWMRAYYAELCDFVARVVGSPNNAEDIVQTMFFSVWRSGAEVDIRNPRPYLFRSVRNAAISFLRRERVRDRWHVPMGKDADAIDENATQAMATVDAQELDRAIAGAVESLPPRCREAFILHREHGLSYAEVAVVMGTSRKTVEHQISRGLAVLRDRLASYLSIGFVLVDAARRVTSG